MRQGPLLSEAALVIEPDFQTPLRVVLPDFGQGFGEVFLKAFWAAKSVWVCKGRGLS